MLIDEVTAAVDPGQYRFDDEQEGIELTQQRISQILALRARIKELSQIPRSKRNDVIATELSLCVFRLYEARFVLDKLVSKLRWLKQERTAFMSASAQPYDARTAPKHEQPATHIAAPLN